MKIKKVLRDYRIMWNNMAALYERNNQVIPTPRPDLIQVDQLNSRDKKFIAGLNNYSEQQIYIKISEYFEDRFVDKKAPSISLDEAAKRIGYISHDHIPATDTINFRRYYNSIPQCASHTSLSITEFEWLYTHGYFPHLYWNGGKPLFHSFMWFIIDFVLRKSKEEIGLGIIKSFKDYIPPYWLLSQYLKLTEFMYNSWNLGSAIMHRADEQARKLGLTGEEYRAANRAIRRTIWINEGTVLAQKLVNDHPLSQHPSLLNYYRDTFAILSFEALPSAHIIDMYHTPSLRRAVMFHYDTFTSLSVHHLGIGNINTYSNKWLSEGYDILFASLEWALSMSRREQPLKVFDIIQKFRQEKEKKIPCRICGEAFTPTKSDIVTCGKQRCILDNKNLNKRKQRLNLTPLGN